MPLDKLEVQGLGGKKLLPTIFYRGKFLYFVDVQWSHSRFFFFKLLLLQTIRVWDFFEYVIS